MGKRTGEKLKSKKKPEVIPFPGSALAAGTPAPAADPLLESLRTIVVSLEEKDSYTYGHSLRLAEYAVMLATEPTLLLLDEPMAGMSADETVRMIDLLRRLKSGHTLILIEHDMDAVFAVADVITVMVNGAVLASGAPDAIRGSRAVQDAYLGEGTA